jgi:hypothetical protein
MTGSIEDKRRATQVMDAHGTNNTLEQDRVRWSARRLG